MSAAAIEVQGLEKTYGKKVEALRGLSFEVASGSVFALLGPNGAGKSTTVKILTTMSRPDAGQARVAGFDVLANPQGVRRVIGCVAQKDAVDLDATGRENVVLQGQCYGMGGTELRQRVDGLLDQFNLTEAADRVSRTYSGGMRRKLGIAIGLVNRPSVLFLDEPTTELDPEARAGLWSEIRRLAGGGVTVLLTTHYLDEADHLAGRVAIVELGTRRRRGNARRVEGPVARRCRAHRPRCGGRRGRCALDPQPLAGQTARPHRGGADAPRTG